MWLRFLYVSFTAELISVTLGAYPSSRSVYYLHTRPAPWAAARDTCSRYGGRLINVKDVPNTLPDIQVLDRILDWNNAFESLTSRVWTGLYKYEVSPSAANVMWHGCETYTTSTAPNLNIKSELLASPNFCAGMDKDLVMDPVACSTSLPYICYIQEGQCWFLPVEDRRMVQPAFSTTTADLNTCAQSCRNHIDAAAGKECWAFSVFGDECSLYTSAERHDFILQPDTYLVDEADATVYLKVCAGGETTPMDPITTENSDSPEAENCTGVTSMAEWQSAVCYCDCDQPPIIVEPEYLVLTTDEKVEKIVEELFVDPANTSAAQRKLISADDTRPSARSIGALGITMMVLVFGGLVLLDLNNVISHIADFLESRKEKVEEENNGAQEQ